MVVNKSMFLVLLCAFVYGMEKPTGDEKQSKRSDGLIHDVVKQMVAEQIERKKIMKAFEEMKNEISEVKRELKGKKALIHNTKLLQSKLLREIKEMKEEVKKESMAKVQKSLVGYNKKVISVTKNLQQRMKNHEKSVKADVKIHENLIQTQMSLAKKEIGILKRNSAKQFNLLTYLQNKINNFVQEVAFTAKLHDHPTTSKTIVFKTVTTNIGGGYNSSDGIFYSPKAGLYMFSVTLVAYKRPHVTGYIMKNDAVIARINEYVGSDQYPSASLTVVLRLAIGDKVWVNGHKGLKYYGSDNSFTGVLINSTK